MRSGWHWARLKSHQQVGAAGHSAQHGAGSKAYAESLKSYIYIFVFLISDYILYSILFIIYKKMFLHGMYKYIYLCVQIILYSI